MKFLLLLSLTAFSAATASAQNNRPRTFQYTPGIGLQERRDGVWQNLLSDSAATRNSLANGFGKRPGVYRLPQDGMPCIVPDSTKTVRMPNAWRGKKTLPFKGNPPRIPNPVRPEFLSNTAK